MTSIFPLTSNFRSDSYLNAFILNALVTALIAATAIELRFQTHSAKLFPIEKLIISSLNN